MPNLIKLSKIRLWGDFIEAFKIIIGINKVNYMLSFRVNLVSRMRAQMKIG